MRFPEFAMERMQSTNEKRVAHDLSESGVEPLTLEQAAPQKLLGRVALSYADGRGREATRALVAAFHRGSDPDDVLLTTGTSEANLLSLATLLGPGDEALILMPQYLQLHGIARGLGARVREVWLDAARGWRLDLDALRAAVTRRTKVVCLCQPNNPTGRRLTPAEVREIAAIASAHGAWILSDEVFRGAELDGRESAGFTGAGERVVVTGGLSKAYGLPGLRIGWIVAPPERIAAAWALKDYTTIAPATLSEVLAEHALRRRDELIGRARSILNGRWPALERWARRRGEELGWTKPEAGAVCFFRYSWPIGSAELARRLIAERSTMLVPGVHFRLEQHVRIGFGMRADVLERGLGAVDALLAELAAEARPTTR